MTHSTTALIALIIGIITAFTLGAAHKHNRLAFADVKDTRAKLWRLRKFAWFTTLPLLIRAALLVTLMLFITANWVRKDINDNGPTPLINKSASPKPKNIPHPYVPKTFGR